MYRTYRKGGRDRCRGPEVGQQGPWLELRAEDWAKLPEVMRLLWARLGGPCERGQSLGRCHKKSPAGPEGLQRAPLRQSLKGKVLPR